MASLVVINEFFNAVTSSILLGEGFSDGQIIQLAELMSAKQLFTLSDGLGVVFRQIERVQQQMNATVAPPAVVSAPPPTAIVAPTTPASAEVVTGATLVGTLIGTAARSLLDTGRVDDDIVVNTARVLSLKEAQVLTTALGVVMNTVVDLCEVQEDKVVGAVAAPTKSSAAMRETIRRLDLPEKRATATTAKSLTPAPKHGSQYNEFMKVHIPLIKQQNPGIPHQVAFRQAAAAWKQWRAAQNAARTVEQNAA